ncbi:hypothetical protein AVEN_429-1 [Araneus ventricosus]|uniref:Uncharacterized protein n=1 Tax=Araneus ventricosus TaxID=182803 RepID=A0A4Y2TLP2_ARAVE|nr:hypothetical protein AVEN_429-1 [Araneus ventricosus]
MPLWTFLLRGTNSFAALPLVRHTFQCHWTFDEVSTTLLAPCAHHTFRCHWTFWWGGDSRLSAPWDSLREYQAWTTASSQWWRPSQNHLTFWKLFHSSNNSIRYVAADALQAGQLLLYPPATCRVFG